MNYILGIETSTSVCSVALFGDGDLIALREITDAKSHASQLVPFITELLLSTGKDATCLSAIAVSKGPGSYTGLRIGVSTAKGMAYALKIPLIAVDTPLGMASGFLDSNPGFTGRKKEFLCPMIDARRMEVYATVYDTDLKLVVGTRAEIIHTDSYMSYLNSGVVHFFGDGAEKCSGLIKNDSAVFHNEFRPSAAYLGKMSFSRFRAGQFEDLAYFEPFYLKDFVATTPVNKLF